MSRIPPSYSTIFLQNISLFIHLRSLHSSTQKGQSPCRSQGHTCALWRLYSASQSRSIGAPAVCVKEFCQQAMFCRRWKLNSNLCVLLLLASAPDEGGGKCKYTHVHLQQTSQSFALSAHSQDWCSLLPAVWNCRVLVSETVACIGNMLLNVPSCIWQLALPASSVWNYGVRRTVTLIARSATVVWNGMHSHCGMLAFNTRRYLFGDVISKFLLATRAFKTALCARFLWSETCHTWYWRVLPG